MNKPTHALLVILFSLVLLIGVPFIVGYISGYISGYNAGVRHAK